MLEELEKRHEGLQDDINKIDRERQKITKECQKITRAHQEMLANTEVIEISIA